MKRIICLIFALLLSASCAFAAVPDISGCTDDELRQLIDQARNRLYINALTVEKDAVLVNGDGILLYMTGSYEFKVRSYGTSLSIECVLVNNNTYDIAITVDDASANGWVIGSLGTGTCPAGKKLKSELYFSLDDAEIADLSELEDLTFTLYSFNAETYLTIKSYTPITFTADSFQ